MGAGITSRSISDELRPGESSDHKASNSINLNIIYIIETLSKSTTNLTLASGRLASKTCSAAG